MKARMFFVLVAFLFGHTNASTVRALNAQCNDIVCTKVQLDLIDIQPAQGTYTTLATLVPPMPRAQAKLLRTFLDVNPAASESYAVVANAAAHANTLYIFSGTTKNVTKLAFSDWYQNQNLNSFYYDTVGQRLLATFGNQVVSIDRQTGSLSNVITLYDNTKFQEGPATVSVFDPTSDTYITSALEAVDQECFYLFAGNLTNNAVAQSACMPNPATNSGALLPSQLVPDNGVVFVSLWINLSVGLELATVNPITQIKSVFFSNEKFNSLGWSIGNMTPLSYDSAAQTVWLYMFDGQHYRFAGVKTDGTYTTGGQMKLPNLVNTVVYA